MIQRKKLSPKAYHHLIIKTILIVAIKEIINTKESSFQIVMKKVWKKIWVMCLLIEIKNYPTVRWKFIPKKSSNNI